MMPLGFCSRALQISQYCVLVDVHARERNYCRLLTFLHILKPYSLRYAVVFDAFPTIFSCIERVCWVDEERCYSTDFGETD